jgi:hypothetical protein
MDWKLVFRLSLFGIGMAVAGVLGWTGRAEPLVWLLIFVVYAYLIAKSAPGRFFLHGFATSVINGLWIAIIHAACFPTFIANNPGLLEDYNRMPHPLPPRAMMFVMGPVVGAVSGLIAGLFAVFAGIVMRRDRIA